MLLLNSVCSLFFSLEYLASVLPQGSTSTQRLETGRSVSTPSNSKTLCSAWCKCRWQSTSSSLLCEFQSLQQSPSPFLIAGMWKVACWLPSLTGPSPYSTDQKVLSPLFIAKSPELAPDGLLWNSVFSLDDNYYFVYSVCVWSCLQTASGICLTTTWWTSADLITPSAAWLWSTIKSGAATRTRSTSSSLRACRSRWVWIQQSASVVHVAAISRGLFVKCNNELIPCSVEVLRCPSP